MQSNVKIELELESEGESKRKIQKVDYLDTEDPELLAAEVLFKNSSKTNNGEVDEDAIVEGKIICYICWNTK